jgi:Flp pilus assembly protein TadD
MEHTETGAEALTRGLVLRERHRWAQATSEFRRAVGQAPGEALGWYWLAVTLDNRGREAEAIPAYRQALALGLPPELATNGWAWLGSSLRKTGHPDEALACFDEAERLGYTPVAHLATFRRLARRALGRVAEARP